MSRAALKRVRRQMRQWGERYQGLSGESLVRDFEVVVALAERAAELERLVRDARGLLDRDYLDALRAALAPRRKRVRR
jgi:hypothetical protein